MLDIVYRLSTSPGKDRPQWFSKRACLANLCRVFSGHRLHLILDAVLPREALEYRYIACDIGLRPNGLRPKDLNIEHIDERHGGRAAQRALEYAMSLNGEGLYFCEDDYLHLPGACEALLEGLERWEYVSLYDHADRYIEKSPNPFCIQGGSELCRIYRTVSTHWKTANSTTMTFGCKLSTLREDWPFIRKFLDTPAPRDFQMWRRLLCDLKIPRTLVSALPGMATHCESRWLSPGVDWKSVSQLNYVP